MGWFKKQKIKCSAVPFEMRTGIFVVRCEGEYRDGCAGNPDAAAIRQFCKQLVRDQDVEGIILDYSCLTYRWGDMIESTLDIPVGAIEGRFKYVPAVFVVGKDCDEALRILLGEDYSALCAESVFSAMPLLEARLEPERDPSQ